MVLNKKVFEPTWLIWEGDDFPRSIHSDSVVFYVNEHLVLDDDDVAKRSLAKQIQQEGISYSLGEAFSLIDTSSCTTAGYRYEDDDESNLPIYCDNDDPLLDYDATFVEISYVY
jgi:hypothetical protein